jgi:hypothetical protein
MKEHIEYKKLKFTDWSKHTELSQLQLKQLIAEKTLRAKIQSEAMKKAYKKLG